MTDFNELLQEEFNWSLVHTVYSSVDNMSDEEVVQESIEKHGSFDNMVKSMAMELEASCEAVKTLN